jgi:phosphohistidine phosphatase
MKRLTLVRHANAEWKDADLADFERPLNKRGTTEATAMGRRLASLDLIPDLLLTSAAARTLQTAQSFAKELELPERVVKADERLYLARPGDMLSLIRETGSRIQHLMLVGHNPGISQLVRQLAGEPDRADLTTASVCSMVFRLEQWDTLNGSLLIEVRYESPPRRFHLWA